MSGFNNRGSGWRQAILSSAAVFALSATPAWAQSGEDATPPRSGPERSGPVSLMPAGEAQPLPPASSPLAPAISVDALERIEMDRIGLIDESTGAMPEDMWTGSDPAFVRAILPQLPHAMPSLAMRRLAQNLLLPQARRPQEKQAQQFMLDAGAPVDPGVTAEADTGTWLLEERIAGLTGMGDWASAIALIELVPQDRLTDGMIRTRIDGLLIEGNTDAACNEAQAALARRPDAHWQKLLVYCQFVSKQTSAAQLGLSLLREQGEDDPLFYWAADVLQGAKPPLPASFAGISPLELAMLRTAALPFPDALVNSDDPTTIRLAASVAVVQTATFPEDKKISAEEKKQQLRQQQDARLLTAERAVVLGVLNPAALAELYAKLDLSQDPSPVPLADATAENVRTRARMYQLAQSQTVPTAKAEVIARVINLARAEKGQKGLDLVTVGRVYAPMLAEFQPSPELIWFAGPAARGLLAAGQSDKAKAWIDLANQMARGSIEAANVANSLWAIEHIMSSNGARLTPQALRAWQASIPPAQAATLREGLLNLLTSLGDTVTADQWLSIVGAPVTAATAPNTPPYVWHGLSLATRQDRVGDVGALSLIALSEAGPHRVAPLTLGKVIESLMVAGREADARALATEAALVQGL